MSSRPSLLYLSQTLPFPPNTGGVVRTHHLLRQLASAFEVTALCFYRRAHVSAEMLSGSLAALAEYARVEAFPIPQEHQTARLVWDHLRSLVSQRAYTVYAYESRPFRRRLTELLGSSRFDLCVLDSLDLCAYLPLLSGLPVVCGHQNAESSLLRRRAHGERSVLKRLYMAHQAQLIEREERSWCGRVALNLVVSAQDEAELTRIAPGSRFAVVPNGVDLDHFQPGRGAGTGIVFMGGMNWYPNRDGLDYFGECILPLVRERVAAVPVRWIGMATDEERRTSSERYAIEMTGLVEDTRPYLQEAACFVVPLRIGGGTRLKILDAWALGKAVVSTSIGCEGLAAVDGVNILIRDTPEAFADAVVEVLVDEALRDRLGAAARATVEDRYGWDRIGASLLGELDRLLERRTPAAPRPSAQRVARIRNG